MQIRTTLRLDEDIYRAAASLAAASRRSIGAVLSDLARKGLRPPPPPRRPKKGRFPTFHVPQGAPPLTPDMVRAALDDDPR